MHFQQFVWESIVVKTFSRSNSGQLVKRVPRAVEILQTAFLFKTRVYEIAELQRGILTGKFIVTDIYVETAGPVV